MSFFLITAYETAILNPPDQELQPMPKKPAYPTKTCPKCNRLIHAAVKSHTCGWTMNGKTESTAVVKKRGRPKGGSASGVTIHDIEAVKELVDRIGAEKVQELAAVLAK